MRQGQPQNRQRSRGRGNNNRNNNRNQLNRSMESNGPDVRIRGTAAHIAEKYTQLATDAQTSGDTVAAQSYWQFAEHYNRLIAAAQAAQQQARDEQDARREARQETSPGDGDDNRSEKRTERRPRRERKPSGTDKPAPTAESDDRPAMKGEGPQPTLENTPAEIALADKPIERVVDSAGANGADKAVEETAGVEEAKPKPRRAKRPRKAAEPAAVAGDDAAALPAFVTGSE